MIITGWSGSAQQLWYPTSASSTRVVGAVIGRAAQLLVDRAGATGTDFWCIGHSLGAHACGHAGNNAHFGRITGTQTKILLLCTFCSEMDGMS